MSNPTAYPHPALAVDTVILCIRDGALYCLLAARDDADLVGGAWALPGGFVHIDEDPETSLARVVADKTGLATVHAEQLATYGAPNRDPRGHVVSITYLAIAGAADLETAIRYNDALTLARIVVDWEGETGGPACACDTDGTELPLAFDHAAILGDTVKRLRGKLDYTPIGFAFLSPRFTLAEAQEVHEAILGRALAKPAFRRKLLDRHALEATGTFQTGAAYRPAELYEVQSKE